MVDFGNLYELPDWTADGLLPTARQVEDYPEIRSPYQIFVIELLSRFGFTTARRGLLRELLDYRAALRSIGVVRGFQWINGSIVENVESERNHDPADRDPADIDAVTFFYVPRGYAYWTLAGEFICLTRSL